MKTNNKYSFVFEEIISILSKYGLNISNSSRIKKTLISKNDRFKIVDKKADTFTFTNRFYCKLDAEIVLNTDNQLIETSGQLFDESLFYNHRGYLTQLFKQANACYDNNCYDACAVLIRRIFEILLILSYEKIGISSDIKDSSGNYLMLEKICSNAKDNKSLDLSRHKLKLDQIRNLGNFSAHKIYYNTRKKDIDDQSFDIRTLFEELLYKSGILK